ncbi:G5 domain-containing protein [uncultured Thomasclavelia sp.]|uniref:G5 domain-containing protein n=1 Tax=uncultured Thomasclavelia sp. TaxID=3025759 RepID=UPI00262CF075|nr:G5 domain-containing protein [uncultured Thomasclavelia sp.]
MNKIKEAVIKADPRMKGLVVVMIAYIGIMFAVFNVGATDQIDNYVETIDVTVEDGNTGQKGYLVRQNAVSDVLDELGIVVNPQDIVNLDLNYVVNDGDLIQITRVNEANIEEVVAVKSNTINTTGLELFTTKVAQQGQDGQVKNTYRVTYQNGNEVSRQLIGSEVISPATDTIIETGTLQEGAYFTGRLTTYGGDCAGGNGTSSSGIKLSPISGVQGSNSAKLTYNGRSYYCLAADPSIPFGTIIEISNHNLSIESTAYGIVVDRGGAIKGNKIDIFNGTEAGKYFSGGTSNNTQFKIISVGSGKNFWK